MSDGFWDNVSGDAGDAYIKTMADVLPNNTMALATVVKCLNASFNGSDYINVEWLLSDGEFKGQHVFQKLHVYDANPDRAIKARNMLKLMFVQGNVKPADSKPPTDTVLAGLVGMAAGIRLQEWSMQLENGNQGHGNFVSEVHPVAGFVCETGKYRDFKPVAPKYAGVESALTRNPRGGVSVELDDDIPF